MSDSSIRVNPSIEEPSNWISPSSAFSNCDLGISTFLITPKMSVNWSLRNRTLSALQTFRISDFVRPGPAASNFRIFAFGTPPSFFRKICRILRSFFEKSTFFSQGDTENPIALHTTVCNWAPEHSDDARVQSQHGKDGRPLALATGSAGPPVRVHEGRRPSAPRTGGRAGDARVRRLVRCHGSRGGRALGNRRPSARLRLRAEPDGGHAPARGRADPPRARLRRGDGSDDRVPRQLHASAARYADEEGDLRLRRARRLHRCVRQGPALEAGRRSARVLRRQAAQGQGVRALRKPIRRLRR